jgi:ATP-binding cassette, subfamily B, bacterial MsbA
MREASSYLFWRLGRRLTRFLLRSHSDSELHGLRLAVIAMLQYPKTLLLMLGAGLMAAVFEGGTLGFLGLSVSVLTSETVSLPVDLPKSLEVWFAEVAHKTSREKLFFGMVGAAISAQIAMSLLSYISKLAQINLAYAVQGNSQEKALKHALEMSYDSVTKYPAGKMGLLVEQSGGLSMVVSEIGKLSRAVMMVVGYMTIMLVMSWQLMLSVVAITFVVWVAITKLAKTIKRLAHQSVVGEVDMWRWTIEFVNASKLTRIFSNQQVVKETIDEARFRRIAAERKSSRISSAILPVFEVVTVSGAGLFLVIGYLISGASAVEVVPSLFVFVLVFFRLKPQMKMLNDFRLTLGKLLPRLELVVGLLDERMKIFEKVGGKEISGFRQGLEFAGVSFSYPGSDVKVLSNISFSLDKGDTLAIVGPSGSGKTTLVNLLLGLYSPTGGSILVDGEPLECLSLRHWRDRIGVVEQDVLLINASIKENITFGRPDLEFAAIQECARIAHAGKFIEELEAGYQTNVGDGGLRLSGGQKQRIALARALARSPDLIVLDEATSALDIESERVIQNAFKEMHKKKTILMIAHRLATIATANKVLVLNKGAIVEQGGFDELRNLGGEFTRMWESQWVDGQG